MTGNPEINSLEDLYNRYSGVIFGYLLRMCGDRSLADELTGETFYQAMLGLDGFEGRSSVKTWLLRIAYYLYLRRNRQERRSTSLERLEDQGIYFTDPSPDPERTSLMKEQHATFWKALYGLAEDDRSVLLLSAQEDLSCQEIAQVLGISVTAMKVRLYRARQRLVKALEHLDLAGVAIPARSSNGIKENNHVEL